MDIQYPQKNDIIVSDTVLKDNSNLNLFYVHTRLQNK